MSFATLPRSSLSSPAAQRIEATARAFRQRLAVPPRIELPPPPAWRSPSVWELVPLVGRVRQIQRTVAAYFDIALADMLSSRRQKATIMPRHVAMYLAKELTPFSLPEIGRKFGGKDHTTILHAVRKIAGLIAAGDPIAADVAAIRASFAGRLQAWEDGQ